MTKSYTLKLGDCHAIMDQLHENSVDAIITDPPYEINFMAKTWDNAGVAFNPITWQKALRVLKPGGHMLVFGHSRKMHRIIVAIEDAGFEIRDTLMWLYGSGFPKSHNISKSIDKKLGAERGIVGVQKKLQSYGYVNNNCYGNDVDRKGIQTITKPTTDPAKQYEGWGTALKPAYEPIVLVRKPFKGSITENVLEYGTGGINIDECRVEAEKGEYDIRHYTKEDCFQNLKPKESKFQIVEQPNGRFPANVIHDGSEEVTSGFPDVGGGNNNGAYNYEGVKYANKENSMFNGDEPKAPSNYNDSGNASRFFYTAKASKKDRDEGLDIYQEKQTGELQGGRKENSAGSKMPNDGRLNPYAGAGAVRRNPHPTVKPTELMQYLVRLITPKGGTVLDPFMGSGSTGKAAMIENNERNANYHFIGIDITEEYIDIAKARIEYGKHYFQNKEKEAQNVDENQTTLFDWEE